MIAVMSSPSTNEAYLRELLDPSAVGLREQRLGDRRDAREAGGVELEARRPEAFEQQLGDLLVSAAHHLRRSLALHRAVGLGRHLGRHPSGIEDVQTHTVGL